MVDLSRGGDLLTSGAGGASAVIEIVLSPLISTKPTLRLISLSSPVIKTLRIERKWKMELQTDRTFRFDTAEFLCICEDDVHVAIERHECSNKHPGILELLMTI